MVINQKLTSRIIQKNGQLLQPFMRKICVKLAGVKLMLGLFVKAAIWLAEELSRFAVLTNRNVRGNMQPCKKSTSP